MFARETESAHSNSLEDHATELGVPVFDEDEPSITIQPRLGDSTFNRRPVPVVVPVPLSDRENFFESTFIPRHGMDFLAGANQLHIQQTVELHDLLEDVDSENRYTVKKNTGETIYYASESSTPFQRACLGSTRAFTMKIYDQTRQEALILKRRLACGICSFWCYLQTIEIYGSPQEYLGQVRQHTSLSTPVFSVYNKHGSIIYHLQGDSGCMCLTSGKNGHFKIYSADGATQLGSVNHQWNQVMVDYNLCLQFPGNVDVQHKALLLGAAFLLEYMFFERTRSTKLCRC